MSSLRPFMRDAEIVGGLRHDLTTCLIDPSHKHVTIDSLIARTKEPVLVGHTGDTLSPLAFVNEYAGRRIFSFVKGYSPFFLRRALRDGEVQVMCHNWDTLRAIHAELAERFVPFLTNRRRSGEKIEKIPLFSDVLSGPSLVAFRIWDKLRDLRTVVVTNARGSSLHGIRNALKATARNAVFVGRLRSEGFPIDYIAPEEIQSAVDAIESMSATSREYWIQGEDP